MPQPDESVDRFWLFWVDWTPIGGMSDFAGSAKTLEGAKDLSWGYNHMDTVGFYIWDALEKKTVCRSLECLGGGPSGKQPSECVWEESNCAEQDKEDGPPDFDENGRCCDIRMEGYILFLEDRLRIIRERKDGTHGDLKKDAAHWKQQTENARKQAQVWEDKYNALADCQV